MERKDPKKGVADQLAEIDPQTNGTAAPETASTKPNTLQFLLNTLVFLMAITAAFSGYHLLSAPVGKINSPVDGSRASRVVEITGYTKNIPPERRYVWVTVDVNALGLCWPKRQIHKSNSQFKTQIHLGGSHKKVGVSLYAADRALHEEILAWFEQGKTTKRPAEITKIPDHFKLDSVMIELGDLDKKGD